MTGSEDHFPSAVSGHWTELRAARFESLSKEVSDEALRLARLVLVLAVLLRCRSLRLPVLAHLTATTAY